MADTPRFTVRVQPDRFDPGAELNAFTARTANAGAVVSFTGLMRDYSRDSQARGETLTAMTLEHYPGMAERQLADLLVEARRRWAIDDATVIHRHGVLTPGEAIVFVAAASAHREAAFAAAEFLMDWLKTQAPFWKKETGARGAAWVEAHAGDTARAAKWQRS
ncbi:MAG: molybdenum cofactor biosynthesis protein MoaE [Rhodospirillaceae bacterium]|nr:molybdenum cofactor biosynthesis protein MoaE [Rhodospirillaceae bacterium]